MTRRAPEIDDRTLCPTSGEICVAKRDLLAQFEKDKEVYHRGSADMPAFDDDDDYNGEDGMYPRSGFLGMNPEMNGVKLTAQIVEYNSYARIINCQGPEFDDCPARVTMVGSVTRSTVLSGLRKILKGV